MSRLKTTARFLAVCVVAYLVTALGQVLFLEVLLREELHPDSPPPVLAFATAGTIISGLVGGTVAAWLGRSRPMLHVLGLIALLGLDTISVLMDNTGHPLWFNLGGAFTIQAAALVGGWIWILRLGARARVSA